MAGEELDEREEFEKGEKRVREVKRSTREEDLGCLLFDLVF